ncbi:hypothetical protein B0T20DRAFT_472377 [Sordaria brevicollis]|uniref:Uncharacterized protein n=1 Tax=Sordaria brevicollis TaxID=83679 RepID=A0AAE0P3C3_SORBR|nr:hypothetical protein B0T20DRAFT_472377 [Sordaria brevicollis]
MMCPSHRTPASFFDTRPGNNPQRIFDSLGGSSNSLDLRAEVDIVKVKYKKRNPNYSLLDARLTATISGANSTSPFEIVTLYAVILARCLQYLRPKRRLSWLEQAMFDDLSKLAVVQLNHDPHWYYEYRDDYLPVYQDLLSRLLR